MLLHRLATAAHELWQPALRRSRRERVSFRPATHLERLGGAGARGVPAFARQMRVGRQRVKVTDDQHELLKVQMGRVGGERERFQEGALLLSRQSPFFDLQGAVPPATKDKFPPAHLCGKKDNKLAKQVVQDEPVKFVLDEQRCDPEHPASEPMERPGLVQAPRQQVLFVLIQLCRHCAG